MAEVAIWNGIPLPAPRGRLTLNAPLAPLNWFRVGGNADVLFRPADAEDLAFFLAHLPHDVPLTFLGAGSNLLVRDGGVRGVVIKLGRGFHTIEALPEGYKAGAAVLDQTMAETAATDGRAGLAFLVGIPGSLGGAVRMNAGCYGREMADVLLDAAVIHRCGQTETLPAAALGLGYRSSALGKDTVVVSVRLLAPAGDSDAIHQAMQTIRAERAESQPLGARTGGSTFANPAGMKAWQLIDAAGCRGLRLGEAMVSPKHCNFLVHSGAATATAIEALGEEVRARVLAHAGVDLRWEIQRVGEATSGKKA